MAELYEIYYEHYFYDNPDDIESKGYEENVSNSGQKYYVFDGDKLLNRCEELIGQGRDDEAWDLINKDVDFSWETTLEDDMIKRKRAEFEKEKPPAEKTKKSNFLERIGVE